MKILGTKLMYVNVCTHVALKVFSISMAARVARAMTSTLFIVNYLLHKVKIVTTLLPPHSCPHFTRG